MLLFINQDGGVLSGLLDPSLRPSVCCCHHFPEPPDGHMPGWAQAGGGGNAKTHSRPPLSSLLPLSLQSIRKVMAEGTRGSVGIVKGSSKERGTSA